MVSLDEPRDPGIQALIVDLAARRRLPAMYASTAFSGGAKTARALGLTIPRALLLRADRLTEAPRPTIGPRHVESP